MEKVRMCEEETIESEGYSCEGDLINREEGREGNNRDEKVIRQRKTDSQVGR